MMVSCQASIPCILQHRRKIKLNIFPRKMEDVIVSSNGIILNPARVLPGASRDLKSAVTQLRQKLLKSWVFDQQLLSGVCVCVCVWLK